MPTVSHAYFLAPGLTDAPRLMTATEAAAVLACSHRNVTKLIASGSLPATRLGSGAAAYRISRYALAEFIERHATTSPGEAA